MRFNRQIEFIPFKDNSMKHDHWAL